MIALRQVVVEEQSGADHPLRPQMRIVRHDEAQRPHDVRRGREQHLALLQRLAHEAEMKAFEVAQAAVNQLGAGGGGVRGEIVLLAEQYLRGARPAASRAMPVPLMPPPTTSTSKCSSGARSRWLGHALPGTRLP